MNSRNRPPITAAVRTTGTQSGTADQCHCQSVTSWVAVFWAAYTATSAPATIRSSRNRIIDKSLHGFFTDNVDITLPDSRLPGQAANLPCRPAEREPV